MARTLPQGSLGAALFTREAPFTSVVFAGSVARAVFQNPFEEGLQEGGGQRTEDRGPRTEVRGRRRREWEDHSRRTSMGTTIMSVTVQKTLSTSCCDLQP